MRIHFIIKPSNGPDWHRLVVPMESLPIKEGDDIQMGIYEHDEGPELFDCDILMFNRAIFTKVDKLLRYQKKYGFKIVVDIDDYWNLNYTHPLYEVWRANGYDKDIISYLKVADLVTTTNEKLRDKVLEYNSNVAIIPNALEFGNIPEKPTGKRRFAYTGSISHLPDIELLRNKFRRVDPFIRDNAVFVLAGVCDDPRWLQVTPIFESTGSYEILPILGIEDYMMTYDNAHVALIPLQDNEFNSCKSVLKVLEAASRGVPCIVSAVWPYLELADAPGITWIYNSHDWLREIRQHIKNPKWSAQQGKLLYTYMKEHYSLDKINQTRYEVLCGVLHQSS